MFTLSMQNPWQIEIETTKLILTPPQPHDVRNEVVRDLPVFKPDGAWTAGYKLKGVLAWECTQTDALIPNSIKVKTAQGDMVPGSDFAVETRWGCLGRIEGGRIGEHDEVYVSYSFYPSRIDSIYRDTSGKIGVVQGGEGMADPKFPSLPEGASLLANVIYRGKLSKLMDSMVFPVSEQTFPQEFFPKTAKPERTLKKLRNGEKVRILAWGDSVTECGFLPDDDRWQVQFVNSLKEKYPQAQIELISVGWGGRTMLSYYQEPAGSPHNFAEKVLAEKADLVISEFVNDAGLTPDQWQDNFMKAQQNFRLCGSEWIILTPHYVRTDWMDLKSVRDCDQDPRPYTRFIREFSAKEKIPMADTALIWGRLYRRGIPYDALFVNGINHPNKLGMSFFRDALMPLFK